MDPEIFTNIHAGAGVYRLADGTYVMSPETLSRVREMTDQEPRPLVEEWPCEGVCVTVSKRSRWWVDEPKEFVLQIDGGMFSRHYEYHPTEDAARLAVLRWCAACAYLAPRHAEWERALEIAKKMGSGE